MALCKHLLVLFMAFSVPGLTDGYDLTILHTGTFTPSYQQFTVTGDECTDDQAAQGNCMGGVARLGTLIKIIRNEEDTVLLLGGGDQLLGQWFSFYKGNATAYFMNELDFDAMAIGNREFALGPYGLASFLQEVQFNRVCSNLDVSEEQALDGLFSSSIQKTIGGERIGIVGYTSERLNDIANVRNVIITDPIESVRREVELLTSQGIDKIIVLGT